MEDDTEEIPSFVLSASDPAAPFALLAYASATRNKGGSDERVAELKAIADEWYRWQGTHGVIDLGRSVMIAKKIHSMLVDEDENVDD